MESHELPTHRKGIQAPRATLAMEAENTTKVIGKDCASKPRAIDETRSLEDVLFLFGDLLHALRIVQADCIWVLIGTALVDLQ